MATFIKILRVLVPGIMEGLAEWLPISNTRHMILLNEIIPLNVSTESKNTFMAVIQLGAILTVIVLYFHRLSLFSPSKTEKQKGATVCLWTGIPVAHTPAVVINLLTGDWMEAYLMDGYVVAVALIVYGVLFIVIERYNEGQKPIVKKAGNITYQLVFCIGLFQVLSLVPGTSRSGAAILGTILLGYSGNVATEFPFFLEIPVMFGTNLLKIARFGPGNLKGIEVFYLLFGMVVAFLISVYSIKFLLDYIRRNDFTVFGFYRIGLGTTVLICFVVIRLITG